MNAKFVLLNHFSQRYPKVPLFNKDHIAFAGVAFDLMCFSFCELPVISMLYYILKALFDEQNEIEGEKEGIGGDMDVEVNHKNSVVTKKPNSAESKKLVAGEKSSNNKKKVQVELGCSEGSKKRKT
jgi:ribonuclease Z